MTHRSLSRWLAASATCTALTFSLLAAAKLAKAGGSTAGFKVAGPAGLTIEGTTPDLALRDDGQNVVVVVPLGALTTGIGLRDKHMKEYLEVQSFPQGELTVARSALKLPSGGASSGDAKGTMKLHGKTKDVTVHYTASPSGDGFDVKGATHIDMRDFGIKVPSYLGVTVKPDVDIDVRFHATDA